MDRAIAWGVWYEDKGGIEKSMFCEQEDGVVYEAYATQAEAELAASEMNDKAAANGWSGMYTARAIPDDTAFSLIKTTTERQETMFSTSEIKNHYLATDNHLAAVTGLMAYQGLHWFDACSTVNSWRKEKREYVHSLEESKRIASLAIRAAKNRKRWGDYATNRFIKKNNIPARVMTAAYRLEYLKQSAEAKVVIG